MKLAKIQEDVESLTNEIKNFNGSKDTKEYRFLEEMLTRQLLALDGIEPDGDTEIRKIRKESIHSVNSLLDSKVRDMTTDHDGSSDRMDLAELTKLNTEMLNSARELLRIKTALKKLMNI